jgi:hypothetical protein
VFSGEQGAHVCSHLRVSSKQGRICQDLTGGGCWKDGGTRTCVGNWLFGPLSPSTDSATQAPAPLCQPIPRFTPTRHTLTLRDQLTTLMLLKWAGEGILARCAEMPIPPYTMLRFAAPELARTLRQIIMAPFATNPQLVKLPAHAPAAEPRTHPHHHATHRHAQLFTCTLLHVRSAHHLTPTASAVTTSQGGRNIPPILPAKPEQRPSPPLRLPAPARPAQPPCQPQKQLGLPASCPRVPPCVLCQAHQGYYHTAAAAAAASATAAAAAAAADHGCAPTPPGQQAAGPPSDRPQATAPALAAKRPWSSPPQGGCRRAP